jgi:hypothetical protein
LAEDGWENIQARVALQYRFQKDQFGAGVEVRIHHLEPFGFQIEASHLTQEINKPFSRINHCKPAFYFQEISS